jgi:iturin family lipopeptide synthetase B
MTAFVMLDELPMTSSGKVDRRNLPEPGSAGPPYVTPRDELESLIAEVWAESLGVEDVGIKHNFFSLAGHSLVVTRIIYELREALGVDLPLTVMFQHPTMESFAIEVHKLLAGEE